MSKDKQAYEGFIDDTTGAFLSHTPDKPTYPLMVVSAVHTAQRGAGIDVCISPAILQNREMTAALVEDVRHVLDDIERRYVKGEEV
jgi:hypothetical protein